MFQKLPANIPQNFPPVKPFLDFPHLLDRQQNVYLDFTIDF